MTGQVIIPGQVSRFMRDLTEGGSTGGEEEGRVGHVCQCTSSICTLLADTKFIH